MDHVGTVGLGPYGQTQSVSCDSSSEPEGRAWPRFMVGTIVQAMTRRHGMPRVEL